MAARRDPVTQALAGGEGSWSGRGRGRLPGSVGERAAVDDKARARAGLFEGKAGRGAFEHLAPATGAGNVDLHQARLTLAEGAGIAETGRVAIVEHQVGTSIAVDVTLDDEGAAVAGRAGAGDGGAGGGGGGGAAASLPGLPSTRRRFTSTTTLLVRPWLKVCLTSPASTDRLRPKGLRVRWFSSSLIT